MRFLELYLDNNQLVLNILSLKNNSEAQVLIYLLAKTLQSFQKEFFPGSQPHSSHPEELKHHVSSDVRLA